MNSGRPVLIIPYAGRFDRIGQKVLVAWNASMEATRAVTAAIPLLKQAQAVQTVIFDPASKPEVHGEQPGADLALYLTHHDIKVEVSIQTTADLSQRTRTGDQDCLERFANQCRGTPRTGTFGDAPVRETHPTALSNSLW